VSHPCEWCGRLAGMTRRERIRRWERWKREQIDSVQDDEAREFLQDVLDDMDMPTREEERQMREIEKMVRDVFGSPGPKKRLRKGTGNGPSRKRGTGGR